MDGRAPNLDELLKNLNHQLSLYRQLVDVLREEREHLVGVSLKEIRDCTYAKEAILDEIHREELRRRAWMKEACTALGVDEKDITLELVGARLGANHEAIFSLKQTLIHFIKKAREMNADNKLLVESALKDAQEMKRNVLGLSGDKPQTYGPNGNMTTGAQDRGARLISKEL